VKIDAVTFVTPHQRVTSGGVHVIEQFARRLAAAAEVTLLVLDGETRPVPGVTVAGVRRRLRSRVPRADVLVVPGDSTRTDELLALQARAGRPVLLIQSLAHPHGDVTRHNMTRVRDGVAVSSWLAERATEAGCRTTIVRPGLDRRVFFPPRGRSARARRVAMLSHGDEWKGRRDGLAALRSIRDRVSDVDLHLFGAADEGADGISHGPLSRTQVAALLRQTAVFVCPSWEEGLGLPGLEALACGAALATTDTGGGRDYALHRRTALVSAPRDPAALADNVTALLEDLPLQRRLADAGAAHVRNLYPTWAVAARRLRAALAQL